MPSVFQTARVVFVGGALPFARFVQRSDHAGTHGRVALAEAVGIARMRVAPNRRFVGEVAAAQPLVVGIDRDEVHALARSDSVPAASGLALDLELVGHRLEALDVGELDLPTFVTGVVGAVVGERGTADLAAGRPVDVAFLAHDPHDVVAPVDATKARGALVTARCDGAARPRVVPHATIATRGIAHATVVVTARGEREQEPPHTLHRPPPAGIVPERAQPRFKPRSSAMRALISCAFTFAGRALRRST